MPLQLDVYLFINFILSCWIDSIMYWPLSLCIYVYLYHYLFIIMYWSLPFIKIFVLKSILFDMSIATFFSISTYTAQHSAQPVVKLCAQLIRFPELYLSPNLVPTRSFHRIKVYYLFKSWWWLNNSTNNYWTYYLWDTKIRSWEHRSELRFSSLPPMRRCLISQKLP